jgi:Iron/zinc purple acid phosphatase-like protein C
MYSSEVSSYQANIRKAFEAALLEYNVDAYLAGHIHWYERLWPLSPGQIIDSSAIVNNNTYITGTGKSLTHLINGMAGNIESHSTLGTSPQLNITAVLNQKDYGFSKFSFHDETHASWSFIKGDGSGLGDTLNLVKAEGWTCSSSQSSSSTAVTSTPLTSASSASAATTTTSHIGATTSSLAPSPTGSSGGKGGSGGTEGSGSAPGKNGTSGAPSKSSSGIAPTGYYVNSAPAITFGFLAIIVPLAVILL